MLPFLTYCPSNYTFHAQISGHSGTSRLEFRYHQSTSVKHFHRSNWGMNLRLPNKRGVCYHCVASCLGDMVDTDRRWTRDQNSSTMLSEFKLDRMTWGLFVKDVVRRTVSRACYGCLAESWSVKKVKIVNTVRGCTVCVRMSTHQTNVHKNDRKWRSYVLMHKKERFCSLIIRLPDNIF